MARRRRAERRRGVQWGRRGPDQADAQRIQPALRRRATVSSTTSTRDPLLRSSDSLIARPRRSGIPIARRDSRRSQSCRTRDSLCVEACRPGLRIRSPRHRQGGVQKSRLRIPRREEQRLTLALRFSMKRNRSSAVGYLTAGNDRSSANVCFGLNRGVVSSSTTKLRKSKPARTSSISVKAISDATRNDCDLLFVLDAYPRSDSFSVQFKFVLLLRHAGRIPTRSPQPPPQRSKTEER